MPGLCPERRLQRVICRPADRRKFVDKAILRERHTIAEYIWLVRIAQASKFRPFAANVSDLQRHCLSEFMLHVEIPILHESQDRAA